MVDVFCSHTGQVQRSPVTDPDKLGLFCLVFENQKILYVTAIKWKWFLHPHVLFCDNGSWRGGAEDV